MRAAPIVAAVSLPFTPSALVGILFMKNKRSSCSFQDVKNVLGVCLRLLPSHLAHTCGGRIARPAVIRFACARAANCQSRRGLFPFARAPLQRPFCHSRTADGFCRFKSQTHFLNGRPELFRRSTRAANNIWLEVEDLSCQSRMDFQTNKRKTARKGPTYKQQDGPGLPARPLMGSQHSSCGSSQSQQSLQSQQQMVSEDHRWQQPPIESPCKQIAALELNSDSSQKNKTKRDKTKRKLLGSKSLSQLVPINFFSKKHKSDARQAPLTTTRSFPNGAFDLAADNIVFAAQGGQQQAAESGSSLSSPALSLRQIQSSASMLGMPRQSTSNHLVDFYPNTPSTATTAPTTTLSPIMASKAGSQNQVMRSVVASAPTIKMLNMNARSAGYQMSGENGSEPANEEPVAKESTKPATKFKTFKNTALVLRDVKNSIGLRIKAKQDNKAFTKLTNEAATPPTKLYSPFNIYTPNCSGILEEEEGEISELDAANPRRVQLNRKAKSKRKLSLTQGQGKKRTKAKAQLQQRPTGSSLDSTSESIEDSGFNGSLSLSGRGDESMTTNYDQKTENREETPKGRISHRHKRHLMQVNKFANFESPAGRLRETVKDVERFQQCIEDISSAIRARGQPLI